MKHSKTVLFALAVSLAPISAPNAIAESQGTVAPQSIRLTIDEQFEAMVNVLRDRRFAEPEKAYELTQDAYGYIDQMQHAIGLLAEELPVSRKSPSKILSEQLTRLTEVLTKQQMALQSKDEHAYRIVQVEVNHIIANAPTSITLLPVGGPNYVDEG